MKLFIRHSGIVAPMDRANVDTDMIIPKQFLKSIKRTGFGRYLFDELRYLDQGQPDQDCSKRPINPEFPLNNSRYQGASILLTRENFGCGSSREHAPWALDDYGFRCLIAPSYADIFFNNCFKNGLLPVILAADQVDQLFHELYEEEGYQLSIDLQLQQLVKPNGEHLDFAVDEFRRYCLLNGLDEIGLTLKEHDAIRRYEQQRQQRAPWLFDTLV
jgi:3-isopropylmalate/(R)-2-methylmalate dehydratase small subunit